MKKTLIIGIVLIILTLSLVVYHELINASVSMYSLTNPMSKIENKKAYINVTYVAGTITSGEKNSFYVMFSDGVQYIVYMSNSFANKINNYLLDNPDDSYKIEGVTKLISNTMEENGKKFVKEWLNHTHNHEEENHSHDITTDEFYEYFGYIYLDNTISLDVTKIIIYITGIIGILLIFYSINTKYHLI